MKQRLEQTFSSCMMTSNSLFLIVISISCALCCFLFHLTGLSSVIAPICALSVLSPLSGEIYLCLHRKERIEAEPADFSCTHFVSPLLCVYSMQCICVLSHARISFICQHGPVKGTLKGTARGMKSF